MEKFDAALRNTLRHEGIDSDHPDDRGGRTRLGITANVAAAHGLRVEDLTVEQARGIYRKDYWRYDAIRDANIAAKLFDIGVNIGPVNAVKMVQRLVSVPSDGVMGPRTAAAINNANKHSLMDALCIAQLDYYVDIVKRNTSQISFLKGWGRRAFHRPNLI